MLERIRKETERIRGIVADLLDYSRPAAEKPQPTRLSDHVASAVALLGPHPRFRGITVENQVSGELPLASASTRIVQVLVNLLLNAADAMGGKGSVTVSAKLLDADAGLALFVRDRGPGVAEADREKIFEPFFTTKQPGQGTGLGLAISRSIAQAQGGDLLLARTDGPGATFVLRLPLWRE
jgi:signal transduction histidine kinase